MIASPSQDDLAGIGADAAASIAARQRRLAGARFADEPERLAAAQSRRSTPSSARVRPRPPEQPPRRDRTCCSTGGLEHHRAGCRRRPVRRRREAAARRRAGCAYRDAAARSSTVVARAGLDQPPCCITATRSAISATTPKSWVMNSTAGAALALQFADQVQDLRLRRDVERRGRLVGDQQLRLEDQRHGDHRALALPAGESGADRTRDLRAGSGSCTVRQQLDHASPGARRGRAWYGRANTSSICRPMRMQRVQRRHRLLEDHRDARAADPRASRFGDRAAAGPRRRTGCCRRLDAARAAPAAGQARRAPSATCPTPIRRRRRGSRRARSARLTSPAPRLRRSAPAAGRRVRSRCRGRCRSSLTGAQPRVERIVQPVADQVDRQHGQQDGDAGNRADPPRRAQRRRAPRRS